jgi:predicted metalloendopeptidase
MISNIRSAFIDLIEESTWMDDASKRRAIEKVR